MRKYLIYISILCCGANCRQTYLPPVTQKNYNYLVVEGYIINGSDSTIIKLSRTTPTSDTIPPNPEVGAQVSVIGDQSDLYTLTDAGNGSYYIPSLTLNNTEKYKLRIVTMNGNVYESDPMDVRSSPPIDSVSWDQLSPGRVNIYVSTHDPQNNTRYYRWDYIETWQYRPKFASILEYLNGRIVIRPLADQIFDCWHTGYAPDILINSSEKLADDVIFKNRLLEIIAPDERLHVEYSILVRQYAINKEAFTYYQQLRNNSQNLGSIFGATPSQLKGNIHNVTDPSEIVIGYMGAGSISQQRMFIAFDQLGRWPVPPSYADCREDSIGLNDVDFYFTHTNYVPVEYKTAGVAIVGILASSPECADCRAAGGTTTKPSFWP